MKTANEKKANFYVDYIRNLTEQKKVMRKEVCIIIIHIYKYSFSFLFFFPPSYKVLKTKASY